MTVETFLVEQFSLQGQVAVVTGGTGVLGSAMARGLARAGAFVGVLGRRRAAADGVVGQIEAGGGAAMSLAADVTDTQQLTSAREQLVKRCGRIDILVNAAGGNTPAATLAAGRTVFDLTPAALREVVELNLMGSIMACQVFGQVMAHRPDGATGRGCMINISSMASTRAITRVLGYSAAKAAVDSVTRWLAVELARSFGDGLRVNAIAPGFFVGEQNRSLLVNPDGSLTDRGQTIVRHTPAGRFGEPDELVGTLIWLCSPGAAFINGIVVPVDGGFSAYSGI
ncbi:MAG TPA: SDR family oxidoreductase [Chloroflexota bacterium]|nr:SDR family oxidoreductase [Chloroflexota bacterium]